MKKLKVPYMPVLDVLDITSIEPVLEVNTPREYITHANWEAYPYVPITGFNIARSNKNFYIRYCVMGNSLKGVYDQDGSPVHLDSCVEFFMKKEDEKHYMNFEFNCAGTCDAARRLSRTNKTSLTKAEYKSIIRQTSVKKQRFAEEKGFYSWSILVIIPLSIMGLDPDNLPEKIRANFYKCADETENPHFVSWSPIDLPEPNFHCPDFFGELYF